MPEIKELSVDTALKIANEIEDTEWRRIAITDIEMYLAKAGEFDRALELSERYDIHKGWILEELSYEDKEKAKEFFKKDLLNYLHTIVKSGLSRDEKVELLDTALSIAENDFEYYKISRAFAELGVVDKSLNALNLALNKTDNIESKINYIRWIAEYLHEVGFRDKAINLLVESFNLTSSLESSKSKWWSLRDLAETSAKCGEFELALKALVFLNSTFNKFYLCPALEDVIPYLYKYNADEIYVEQAFKLAENIDDFRKYKIIEHIIKFEIKELKAVRRVGDLLKRLEALEKTLKMYRDHAKRCIAMAYAVIGDYDYAIHVAEQIGDVGYRSTAIGYVAYRLAKDGYVIRAKSLLENLNYYYKALCYIRLGEIEKVKELTWTVLTSSDSVKRVVLELCDVGRYRDAVELAKYFADKCSFGVRELLGGLYWRDFPDPDYESYSLIHRILSSDLNEREKIDLINEIYQISKNVIDQKFILTELAKEIAWYSLRDKIVERAKRLEREGYIEKAMELYGFAGEVEEAERLRRKLVDFEVEVSSKLTVNEIHDLRIVIKALKAVYDLKIKFKSQNIKIYKDGKETTQHLIPTIVKYSTHEESFEVVPLNAGKSTLNISFNFDDQTVTKTVIINVSDVKRQKISEHLPSTIKSSSIIKREQQEHSEKIPFTVRSPTTSHFPSQLLSKYEPLELLGEGGFSLVFKCKRKKDGKLVAVKIPKQTEEAGKSFILELNNWRRLKHEYIAELYDFNVHPYPHIEMELCDGTLSDVKASYIDLLWLLYKIAKALEYAHGMGVVHGDLKPSNILIKRIGNEIIPKLTDWGTGYTPEYASPEQLEGKADERSDIWSFGVIAYELLTGRHPFAGEDLIETMFNIKRAEPEPPPKLSEILMKCLRKNPDERYRSFSELCEDLSKILRRDLNDSIGRSISIGSKLDTARYSMQYVYLYILQHEFDKAKERIDMLTNLIGKQFAKIMNSLRIVMNILYECYSKKSVYLKDLLLKYDSLKEYLPEELWRDIENDENLGGLIDKLKCHNIDLIDEDEVDEIIRFCYRLFEKINGWILDNL